MRDFKLSDRQRPLRVWTRKGWKVRRECNLWWDVILPGMMAVGLIGEVIFLASLF